jgi:hypothetical protein
MEGNVSYPLVAVAVCVVASLLFVVWRGTQLRRAIGAGNPAQNRFAMRFVAAALIASLAVAALLVAVPLPITAWGYTGIGAVYCAGMIGLVMWCGRRLEALRHPS